MIKAIIFDCFGVFYDDPMREFVGNTPLALQPKLQAAIRNYDLGVSDDAGLVATVSTITGLSPQQVKAQIYQSTLTRNQALLDYSQELRHNYKIGLLSNLSPFSMDKYFTQKERQQFFDVVLISGDVGVAKPQPEIYLMCCQRLGVLPAEAIMIDDIQINCDGARQVGMQAILYKGLSSLRVQLPKILEN